MVKLQQLKVRSLGLIGYADCLSRMRAHVALASTSSLSTNIKTAHEIWLVQHPSVFSQGQAGKAQHLLNPGDIAVIQADRGGQVTYHGPGQLIAYLLLNLPPLHLNVRSLVDLTTRSVIQTLKRYDISSWDDARNPGVYTAQGKIASLGFRVRKHLSYHGVALNANMDLAPFKRINPCGLINQSVTSIVSHNASFYNWPELEARLSGELIASLERQLKQQLHVIQSMNWPPLH